MLHYYIEPKILTNLLTEYEVEYIKKSCLNNFHRSRTSGNKIVSQINHSKMLNPRMSYDIKQVDFINHTKTLFQSISKTIDDIHLLCV